MLQWIAQHEGLAAAISVFLLMVVSADIASRLYRRRQIRSVVHRAAMYNHVATSGFNAWRARIGITTPIPAFETLPLWCQRIVSELVVQYLYEHDELHGLYYNLGRRLYASMPKCLLKPLNWLRGVLAAITPYGVIRLADFTRQHQVRERREELKRLAQYLMPRG